MAYFLYNINSMKRIFRISNLKYVVAFLIPLIFVMLINQALDNDSWVVLAGGRHIINNGVYYTDVLSMHEGLEMVEQNYGFSVIFWLIYSTFGSAGIYIGMLLLNLVVCWLIYKIAMLISNKNVNLSLLVMMTTNMILALGFVTTRAQMIDYVIFLTLIYILELYIKTGKTKPLWFILILSLLQINLHASMWWVLMITIVVYVIDSIKAPKIHLQGYKTKPLIWVAFASFIVGLINPYGIKMIMFIFEAYGDPTMENLVIELHSFKFSSFFEALLYIVMVLVIMICIFGKRKTRMRWLLMFFGFLALGLNTIKGMSQFILVMFLPLVFVCSNVRIEKLIDAEISRKAIVFWCGVLAICVFATECVSVIPNIKNGPSDVMIEVMDLIDERNAKNGKTEGNIYVGYNNGGYVEFRGYRAYIDSRGGVFSERGNKKADILKEYADLRDKKIEPDEFLDKYDFDYVIATEYDGGIYEINEDKYDLIYENEKIKLFEVK